MNLNRADCFEHSLRQTKLKRTQVIPVQAVHNTTYRFFFDRMNRSSNIKQS